MNNEKELRHRKGWTPAPTKPAYSQTNVSLEHKGRDYDAILRAAKRKPVGYWEDAPRGAKFNQDIDFIEPNPPSKELRDAYNQALKLFEAKIEAAVTAPTPTQSGDGPWPKCVFYGGPRTGAMAVFQAKGLLGLWHMAGGGTVPTTCDYDHYRSLPNYFTFPANPEAAQWLEQNGHKDAAAQLRGKAAAARVWKSGDLTCANLSGAKVMVRYRGEWSKSACNTRDFYEVVRRNPKGCAELFGPERDAIIVECCAAMKLDPMTGEPLHA